MMISGLFFGVDVGKKEVCYDKNNILWVTYDVRVKYCDTTVVTFKKKLGGIVVKKLKLIILSMVIILILWRLLSKEDPHLKGPYQSEMIGNHIIQMLIREKDNSFIEWINNREVDRGTYEKIDTNLYRIKSNRQIFEVTLKDDNSFEIVINKLNDGKPINMKNISTNDTPIRFGDKFDDVDEYKALLD